MRPLIYALVIAAVAMVFALQNSEIVEIQFLTWNASISQALLIIITLVVGVIVGLLAATKSIWNKRSEIGKQKKQITALEKTVEELRKNVNVTIPQTGTKPGSPETGFPVD